VIKKDFQEEESFHHRTNPFGTKGINSAHPSDEETCETNLNSIHEDYCKDGSAILEPYEQQTASVADSSYAKNDADYYYNDDDAIRRLSLPRSKGQKRSSDTTHYRTFRQ